LVFWKRFDTGEASIGPKHEDEVEYQEDNKRHTNTTEGALGRIDLLAAAMRALAGRRSGFGPTGWALLRSVLTRVAARRWGWGAARWLLLPLWLRSAEGLLFRFDAPRRRAGGGTASNGAAVSILEGTPIGPKDEFSGGTVAGAAGLPMRISS